MIPLKEKIGYGLGDMASSMFWKLFGAYLMIFYTDVFGLPAAIVGTMFLITRIWDSFFDPVVGVIADRTNSRWGKFRPYLLWLAVPFGVIGILTFYTPDFPLTGKIIFAYTTYSLMMMVYSAINVPYASLLGVMSPHPEDRNVLSAFRMAFAYASVVSSLCCCSCRWPTGSVPASVAKPPNRSDGCWPQQSSLQCVSHSSLGVSP